MTWTKTIHLSQKAVERIQALATEKNISFSEAVELLSNLSPPDMKLEPEI